MDELSRTKKLEDVEEKQESEITGEDEKEYDETIKLDVTLHETERLENRVNLDKILKLEEKMMLEVSKIKGHLIAIVDYKTKQEDMNEFRAIMSKLVLNLGEIDEHRQAISDKLNILFKEDKHLLESIHKKIQDEKLEIIEKNVEGKIREHMFDDPDRMTKSIKPDVELSMIEGSHADQVETLRKEKTELEKLLVDATAEEKLAKLLYLELRSVKHSNMQEARLINEIANIIGHNNLLEIRDIPNPQLVEKITQKLELLIENLRTELLTLDSMPDQIVELKKEEVVDKEELKILKQMGDETDIRHKYVI